MPQITKGMAKGSFVLGLLLIGFGALVFILRDIFALLAAAIFFIAGLSAISYAIKLLITMHKMKKNTSNPHSAYRENVQIHTED